MNLDELCNDIAQDLELGFQIFLDLKTKETIKVLEDPTASLAEEKEVVKELKRLKKNKKQYQQLFKWGSRESYWWMEEFTEELECSTHFRKQLQEALQQPKPFRNFQRLISTTGEFREEWFKFKLNFM